MNRTMTLRKQALLAALASPALLIAQASLTALNAPLTIDFSTTVPGVNNDYFQALPAMGDPDPGAGQLDADAWDYNYDGATSTVISDASSFPGTLPAGNGYAEGGAMATGVNATGLLGQFAFGIQPTGGHFTAGSLTLRVQNNSGAAIEQLAVAYQVGIFNDMARSNSFTLYWSATNALGSYAPIAASQVVSPADADPVPQWAVDDVSVTINGFSVPDGGYLYLRWVGDDISGSGQRDEFALTNIVLTAQPPSGPVLTASTASLPAFAQSLGSPSAAQAFTVSGSGLVDDVAVTVGEPFQISLNEGFGYGTTLDLSPVGGTISGATVWVRLNNGIPGMSNGQVLLSSPGTNGWIVSVSGVTSAGNLPTLHLNELQAANAGSPVDEYGEADDWFEIYNPNAFEVDLAGWYVSDNPSDPTKYRFSLTATDAIVPANGWLLVWADNQSAQGNLHTNFGLSSTNGEDLLLVGPDGATIVDEVSFGPQAVGVSYGRQTDGGMPWVTFTEPTPSASNNPVGMVEPGGDAPLAAWPSPASESIRLNAPVSGLLLDAQGREVMALRQASIIDVSTLQPGVYLLRMDSGRSLRLAVQR
ncbi:MAG: lamin tail domain-containing protein [Flavobacteriales bacterium]